MRTFTPAELAVLRASDHVVDQQEPGGALYLRDRAQQRAQGETPRRGRPRRSRSAAEDA